MEPTPAFVLHRRRYGDTSLLLEAFTLSRGRMPLVARGAASVKSRRQGLLQPFVPLLLGWRGRGSVATLATVEAVDVALPLAGRALYSGFYLNELLMRLLPRDEAAPLLFGHYRQALSRLADPDALESVLRTFELQLLDELGYAPDLCHEADGKPVRAGARYCYQNQHGLVVADGREEQSISGATLLALAEKKPLKPEQLREARALMRGILAFYLGGRPLKSRELFRTMAPSSRPCGNAS